MAAVEYANQQKNLRTKARGVTAPGSGPQLEHFEQFEVAAKASFGLLGDMAGQLLARHRPAPDAAAPTTAEYVAAAKELFEHLCAAVDLPPSIIGQCVNVADKLIADSRPKKIKTVVKLDSAAARSLEEDNMGEDERPKRAAAAGGAGASKAAGGAEDGAGDVMLTADDLARIAEQERKEREEDARVAEAQRRAAEQDDARRRAAEEQEQRLRANARTVTTDVPIGMAVLKKDDDDEFGFGAMAGKGKAGKGGAKRK